MAIIVQFSLWWTKFDPFFISTGCAFVKNGKQGKHFPFYSALFYKKTTLAIHNVISDAILSVCVAINPATTKSAACDQIKRTCAEIVFDLPKMRK
jgi:hypothetical protein